MIGIDEINDIPTLLNWRKEVLGDVFGIIPSKELLEENRHYYEKHITDGLHYAIKAQWNGEDAGCGSVCFSDELPSPDNPTGRCAYLMNIYVRNPFRNNGIAHSIVGRLITEAKKRNCGKIYLETTAEGKSVYSSLGFNELPDMMKYYDTNN